METLLEELWFDYQIEKSSVLSKKRKGLQCSVAVKLDLLLEMLNDEQKRVFEEYKESVSILECELEKDAFVDGVRFGGRIIAEIGY